MCRKLLIPTLGWIAFGIVAVIITVSPGFATFPPQDRVLIGLVTMFGFVYFGDRFFQEGD